MTLRFVTNARFTKASNGYIYGFHTSINSTTFQHYLRIFDKIKVIARLEEVNHSDFPDSIMLSTDNIELLPLPQFIGPIQFLRQQSAIKSKIAEYLKEEGVTICRVPGTLGRLAANYLHSKNEPYGVEVAGDPYELFAPGSMNSIFRLPLRIIGLHHLKKIVWNASAALYVTEHQLQKRYPVRKGVTSTHASNVILPDSAFVETSRVLREKSNYILICVGTLDQMYKSPDVLLNAVKVINDKILPFKVSLIWLGEGKYKEAMNKLAETLSISQYVSFLGMVKPVEKVRSYLDQADLFILPSRTEGLPRAMIEAMARALPCVGTHVGGIPELLPSTYLVPVNDTQALVDRILLVLHDKQQYAAASAANLEKAKSFGYEKLNQRRIMFYKKIVLLTKVHLDHS